MKYVKSFIIILILIIFMQTFSFAYSNTYFYLEVPEMYSQIEESFFYKFTKENNTYISISIEQNLDKLFIRNLTDAELENIFSNFKEKMFSKYSELGLSVASIETLIDTSGKNWFIKCIAYIDENLIQEENIYFTNKSIYYISYCFENSEIDEISNIKNSLQILDEDYMENNSSNFSILFFPIILLIIAIIIVVLIGFWRKRRFQNVT